jgi:hypothetical protein
MKYRTPRIVSITRIVNASLLLFLVAVLVACTSVYYSAMERVGIEKRDLLVKRVTGVQDEQIAAKKQFESSLEELSDLINFQGGELERKYRSIKSAYEKSEDKAKSVSNKIDSVESVAEDLFREWAKELKEYSNESLRQKSRVKLERTRERYKPLIAAMRKSEAKMPPVLSALKDQVLYLKHNLNAEAIAALKTELSGIETDVASLIREMDVSIREAERFLSSTN